MSRCPLLPLIAVLIPICAALGAHWRYGGQESVETRMPVDGVLDGLGTFVCGDSGYSLEISQRPSGATSIKVLKDGPRGVFTTERHPVFETGAQWSEDWFVAMDPLQRIWIYIGASANGDGRAAPSVFMHGATSDKFGNITTATWDVFKTGNWTGAPQEFLTRVRAADSRFVAEVPAISPGF